MIASFVFILSCYRECDMQIFFTSKSSIISISPDSSSSCRPLFYNNGWAILFVPLWEACWYFSWLAALRLIFAKYSLRYGLLIWTRLRVSATSLDLMWKSSGASQAKLGLKFISNTQGLSNKLKTLLTSSLNQWGRQSRKARNSSIYLVRLVVNPIWYEALPQARICL